MRSSIQVTALLAAVLLAACGGRAVFWGDSGGSGGEGGARADRTLVPDWAWPVRDAGRCGPELQMGLVSNFFEGKSDEFVELGLGGALDYHGPVTRPLTSSPLFDREIRIGGRVIQYYLPPGLKLPLVVKPEVLYLVTMKRRNVPGLAFTQAMVITGNHPAGPWPFEIIAEPATFGQALQPDDPRIAPLTVKHLEKDDCPTHMSASCASIYVDRLRFEAITGEGVIALDLEQGEIADFDLRGHRMQVVNVASWHQRPACPGGSEERWSYLVVRK